MTLGATISAPDCLSSHFFHVNEKQELYCSSWYISGLLPKINPKPYTLTEESILSKGNVAQTRVGGVDETSIGVHEGTIRNSFF